MNLHSFQQNLVILAIWWIASLFLHSGYLTQAVVSSVHFGESKNDVPSLPWSRAHSTLTLLHWPLKPDSSSQKLRHDHSVRWVDQYRITRWCLLEITAWLQRNRKHLWSSNAVLHQLNAMADFTRHGGIQREGHYNRTSQEWSLNQYRSMIFAGISCFRIYAHKYVMILQDPQDQDSRANPTSFYSIPLKPLYLSFLKWWDQLKCWPSHLFATGFNLIKPYLPSNNLIESDAKTFLLLSHPN